MVPFLQLLVELCVTVVAVSFFAELICLSEPCSNCGILSKTVSMVVIDHVRLHPLPVGSANQRRDHVVKICHFDRQLD